MQCSAFEDCSAPLCPLDSSLPEAVWYPDEDICTSRQFAHLHWIKIQRRISKLKVKDGYFTAKQLSAIKRVSKGITGANPDKPLTERNIARDN